MFEKDSYEEDVKLFKKVTSTQADEILSNEDLAVTYIGRGTCPFCRKFAKKLSAVFPKQLKTHDLYKLSKQLKLKLNEGEEDLLRRLSHHATWAGRYPAPLNHKDFPGLVRFSNGKIFTLRWFGSNDVETINKFVASLPERLGLHISHKWPVE